MLLTISVLCLKAKSNSLDSLLTTDEINWLETHKDSITFSANPYWYPGEFIDPNGQYQGIVSDYIKIFENKLGVHFKFVASQSWDDMLQKVLNGKIDFVGAISKLPEREDRLIFSEAYLEIPQLIIIRDNYPGFVSRDRIRGMKLAGVKGYASVKYMRDTYPNVKITEFEDDLTALLQTSLGKTDGTIIDKMTANYMINKYKISNLSLGFTLNYPMDVRFASQKDKSELISIFNKLLNTISKKQKSEIYNKWINPREFSKLNFIERNYQSFVYLGLGLLIIIVLGTFYTINLGRQVRSRTMDLQIEMDKKNKALEIAEEGNKLKAAFLNNLSHEIRTPMNGIINCSSFLKEDAITKEEISEFTGIIEDSAQHLLNILDDVLEMSKLETNQVSVSNSSFEFHEFVASIFQRFKLEAEEKGLNLYLQRDNKKQLIYTDKTKVRQIISNLITNALKYTLEGEITLGYKLSDDSLEFFVKDTGIGIADENHDLIFEKFRQIDSSTKRKYGGNGIGLSITKALVVLLGGSIWVESRLGEGSTFYFILPVKAPKEANVMALN